MGFNGVKTTQTGSERKYKTPPLSADTISMYEVRAQWMENGQLVTRTQEVRVEPGKRASLSFAAFDANLGAPWIANQIVGAGCAGARTPLGDSGLGTVALVLARP